MKKILTTFSLLATLSATLSADFIRVEAGLGVWNQTNVGFVEVNDDDSSGRDTSDEVEKANVYLWAYVKHPLPMIPNLRVEYSKVESEGHGDGTFSGVSVSQIDGDLPTTLEMTQIEVIPYYNVVDNTFWATLDVGIAIKFMDYSAIGSYQNSRYSAMEAEIYNESDSFIVPLPYLRARAEIPGTELGVEAVVKYGAYDGNTFSDMNIKVDYTFDTFAFQPGIEIGYREIVMDAASDDDSVIIDLDFSGLYFGVMARF